MTDKKTDESESFDLSKSEGSLPTMESDWDDMDAFGDNMHAFDTIDVDASSIFEMFANQWFARLANRGELGQKVVMTETTEIRRER